MHIAICDDEKEFLLYAKECVIKILFNIKDEIYIDTYLSGSELLKCNQDYDILILDINMPDIDGIELARKIREENETIKIIFLTSIIQYVFESFKVNPFRYVMKDKLKELLPEAVLNAYGKIKLKTNQSFTFYYKGRAFNIPLSEILYFEFKGRLIYIYMKNEKYTFYGKLSDLENQLKNYNFVRSHSAYLVNINKIKAISYRELILYNDKVLPISKIKYLSFKDNYFNHLRNEVLT